MESNSPENADPQPRRRRRRSKQSSKEAYQKRQRLKELAFWAMVCLLGGAVVTAIAVLAGGSASN